MSIQQQVLLVISLCFMLCSWVGDAFSSSSGRLRRVPRGNLLRRSSTQQQDLSNDCPYSKAYRRYRIDLTILPEQNRNLFASVLQTPRFLVKANLEKKFGQEIELIEGQTGVDAFASLWRVAADLTTSEAPRKVVALPDADKRIVFNFVELMDWIEENLSVSVQIKAKIVEGHNEVVEFIRIGPASHTPVEMSRDETEVWHTIVDGRQQAWVKRILVELGICPFTKSVTKSGQGLRDLGVPVGKISYHTSDSNPREIYRLMADTWCSIADMLNAGPDGNEGISSILLAAPAFDDELDVWAGPVFALLESGVLAAQASAQVGVVCFHPCYATPDGTTWPGFGHMHSVPRLESWVLKGEATIEHESDKSEEACPLSTDDIAAGGAWQRRTPHATINVLRADQLEKAESKRDTPKLYRRNIRQLMAIGNTRLTMELEKERRLGQ